MGIAIQRELKLNLNVFIFIIYLLNVIQMLHTKFIFVYTSTFLFK